jgi:hypothetical protein
MTLETLFPKLTHNTGVALQPLDWPAVGDLSGFGMIVEWSKGATLLYIFPIEKLRDTTIAAALCDGSAQPSGTAQTSTIKDRP